MQRGLDAEDGRSKYITVCDAKSGFWQTPVRPEHQWLTGFVCDEGLFEWTRTPFGMKNSGQTIVRAISEVLRPLRKFSGAFIDDMAVWSDEFVVHIRQFLRGSVLQELH
mgnify:CR=1 FL=1